MKTFMRLAYIISLLGTEAAILFQYLSMKVHPVDKNYFWALILFTISIIAAFYSTFSESFYFVLLCYYSYITFSFIYNINTTAGWHSFFTLPGFLSGVCFLFYLEK